MHTEKNETNNLERIRFIMLIGKCLHHYGASSDRIEKALILITEKMGLTGDFFSVPTSLIASFKIDDRHEETRMERLLPGKVNLSKLYYADKIVDEVLLDQTTVSKGSQTIANILKDKPEYNHFLVDLSYSLIGISISIFLGGSMLDAMIAGLMGFGVGFFSENVKEERLDSIREGIVAFLVSTVALLLVYFNIPIKPNILILSSLITLVPGLMLTTAIGELASQNLTSGTARFMGSIVILLKITFGVYLSSLIFNYYGVTAVESSNISHPLFIQLPFVVLSGLGFAIAFQSRKKDIAWIILSCLISYFSSRFFVDSVGPAGGHFCSGCLIGMLSNLFARIKNMPSLIFLLPALILQVPGSIGFKSINLLFDSNPIEGINTMIAMTIIGIGLVSGIYFGSLLIKPRRSL